MKTRLSSYCKKTLTGLVLASPAILGSWMHRKYLPWWGHLIIWAGLAAYYGLGYLFFQEEESSQIKNWRF